MRCLFILLSASLLTLPALAQENHTPSLSGYVTHLESPTSFDVNGMHVQLAPHTVFATLPGGQPVSPAIDHLDVYLGEPLDIDGKIDGKTNTITAKRITLYPPELPPIGGTGIIDLVPKSRPPASDGLFFRADGYLMLLPPNIAPSFNAPLTESDVPRTNLWIVYHGTPRADGVLVLDRAELRANAVNHDETKLRAKHSYDPATVDSNVKQSAPSKFFFGIDPKKIPPHTDPEMQARIERIGLSLVPEYQRSLPDEDITRIEFRFQLVDNPKIKEPLALENGIVLVPFQMLKRLKDDAQLAAILADSVADILEKQAVHKAATDRNATMTSVAGDVAGLFVPGLGVATALTASGVQSHLLTLQQQQSGRVSLCLLRDAGYDITKAPEAWHILAAKPGKAPDTTRYPARSIKLYEYLGEIWRSPPPM